MEPEDVHHAGIDGIGGERSSDFLRASDHRTGGNEEQIPSLAKYRQAFAHVWRSTGSVDGVPFCAVQANVSRSTHLNTVPDQCGRDGIVGRAPYGHSREGPHQSHILHGMVGGAECTVVDAGADSDEHHAQIHRADVEADLLEAAECVEGEDVEQERTSPGEGKAGRNANGVLFGDPRIQVLKASHFWRRGSTDR